MKILAETTKGPILVDDEDYERFKDDLWDIDGDYPYRRITRPKFRLHRLIMGKPPAGLVTDHIDRNKLNNQRNNLRFVTEQVNNLNKVKGPLHGISMRGNKYRVHLCRNYKDIHLCGFATLAEAQTARDDFIINFNDYS